MLKWKVFFWLLLYWYVASFLYDISSSLDTELIIVSVLKAMLLIPYFGFAYNKRFGYQLFWKITFLIQAALVVVITPLLLTTFHFAKRSVSFRFDESDVVSTLLFAFLSVILLIPPYLYAFKSNSIWSRNN